MHVPFPTFDVFSLPVLLAVFSLCTSILAIFGTFQLVISSPVQQRDQLEAGLGSKLGNSALVSAPAVSKLGSISMQMQMAMGMGLSSSGLQSPFQRKNVTPGGMWWSNTSPGVSPMTPSFIPLDTRPPLSMAKLIMLRHADSQRRANQRARARMAQLQCY